MGAAAEAKYLDTLSLNIITYNGTLRADTGDVPWEGELPLEALAEIQAAKGTVYEMGAKAWWCASQA